MWYNVVKYSMGCDRLYCVCVCARMRSCDCIAIICDEVWCVVMQCGAMNKKKSSRGIGMD